MTVFVGIDVAKEKHDIAMINESGQLIEAFQIRNNQAGFYQLLTHLEKLDANPKLALEATGHYSHNISQFLRGKNYLLWTYNPLIINQYAKSLSLRKTKTDTKDAFTIASKLRADNPSETIQWDNRAFELRILSRHRERLIKSRSNYKVQFVKVLDLIFPELAHLIGKANLHTKSIYELLEDYPSARKLAHAHGKTLLNIQHLRADKALEIKTLARVSIGTESPALSFELQQVISELRHLTTLITALDKEIKTIMNELDSPILSIPGIGDVTGAVILGEIASIDNFQTRDQLLAYAGIEPSIYQSGQSDINGHMVKRGSTHLRRALILSARITAMHSPIFKAYLHKKMDEGKHYNVAITHVAKKLIRVVFTVLKTGQPYDETKLR
jgi:transposase